MNAKNAMLFIKRNSNIKEVLIRERPGDSLIWPTLNEKTQGTQSYPNEKIVQW